jgi:hypothetical protein
MVNELAELHFLRAVADIDHPEHDIGYPADYFRGDTLDLSDIRQTPDHEIRHKPNSPSGHSFNS